MKSKAEHIQYWLTLAQIDWESVEVLFSGKKFVHALFFAHLAVEKTCKAIWIASNQANIPPRTHNTVYLLSQTIFSLSDNQKEFLLALNRFQIEGRYPSDITTLARNCTEDFALDLINKSKEFTTWLQSKLP